MTENICPSIQEKLEGSNLHVWLTMDCSSGEAYEYAFYLLKEEQRVKTVWYQKEPEVCFALEEDGVYTTISFVRRVGTNEGKQFKTGRYFSYIAELVGYSEKPSAAAAAEFPVSIWGSCVSRDVLEFGKEHAVRIALKSYIARQSVISAVSAPVCIDREVQLDSAFQRRMVLWDLEKTGLDTLRNDGSDYLIVDLIDERFDLVKAGESFATLSNEAVASGIWGSSPERVTKKKGLRGGYSVDGNNLDDYIGAFADRIQKIYRQDHIIIHAAYMKDHFVDEHGEVHGFPLNHIANNAKVNAMLRYMYQKLRECIPQAKWVDVSDRYCADSGHKWGLSPMHYQVEYYLEVYHQFAEIVAGDAQ